MGLSSSQGRLLMLTSRLSDIELQEIMISQRQNQLAMQKTSASEKYMEAMNNYKLTINLTSLQEDGDYTVEDLNYNNMTQMGYIATDFEGNVYLKKKETTGEELLASLNEQLAAATDEETKNSIQARIDEVQAKIDEATQNGEEYTESSWVIPTNAKGEPLLTINEDGTATVNGTTVNIKDGTAYLSNKNVLQNLLMNNMIGLHDTNSGTSGITGDILESDTQIEYVLDTSDDAAAESEYNYDLTQIEAQDNKLDLELQTLETQHEAVMKEYDSVKEVISKNVDRTFSLFSNG